MAGSLIGGAMLVIGALAGCSGGTTTGIDGGGTGTSSFRVVACNIGCTTTGACAGGEIGLNEAMVFEFNQLVFAPSVSPSGVNIVATTGETPRGRLVVDGRKVIFQPEVNYSNGTTTFGYRANADYVVTIPSSSLQPVRSLSGEPVGTEFSCTVHVSSEIVDVDGEPPRVVSILPNPNSIIDQRPTIVIEFSELLDFGSFYDGDPAHPAVEFWTGTSGATPDGLFFCDPVELLPGSPVLSNDPARAVTILRFVPQAALPAESCLTIVITEAVKDLAGTPAVRQQIPSMFIGRPGFDQDTRVTFDDDTFLDRTRSTGDWSGGVATFGNVGGDGRHGDFDPADGTLTGLNTYLWSSDDQVLAVKDTTIGSNAATIRVTDGRFYFSRFVIPAGVTVDFRGANPAQIFVRGECRIDGRVLCNGETVADNFNGMMLTQPPPAVPPGQPGGVAGAGGGAGGDGAHRADGGGPQPIFDGRDGENLTVPGSSHWSGHAGLASTGGKGSLQFPTHGLNTQIQWFNAFATNYALETGKGGGGGGFIQAGTSGSIVAPAAVGLQTNNIRDQRAASGAAGVLFDNVITQSRPAGTSSVDYYLIGGAGGGGGGSHPALARQIASDPNPYRAGAAGSGGGGALLIRVGNGLTVGGTGAIQARGGNAPSAASLATLFQNGAPLPGGGGSGGSVLLQADGGFTQQGTIDVSGGLVGKSELVGFYTMNVRSGAGGPGHVRLEAVGGPPASGGSVIPGPAGLGEFLSDDWDERAGFMSTWVSTLQEQQPRFRRYEIDATVDGVPVLYTEDPEIPNGQPAFEGLSPLVFMIQSIQTDPTTGQPLPNAIPGPWRRYVGSHGASTGEGSLVDDGGNGFRFVMYIDRTLAADVQVDELRIVYRL